MKTITKTVYEFDELNDRAKEKARDWYREHALDYDWWECVYEDAANIGLKITGFDLGRAQECTGVLTESIGKIASLIISNHGKTCDTYKLACDYYEAKKLGAPMDEDTFKRHLLECYRIMLDKEFEYLNSSESVDENIRANEYTFSENGKREG